MVSIRHPPARDNAGLLTAGLNSHVTGEQGQNDALDAPVGYRDGMQGLEVRTLIGPF